MEITPFLFTVVPEQQGVALYSSFQLFESNAYRSSTTTYTDFNDWFLTTGVIFVLFYTVLV
jgi:hypothetical protein